MSKYSAGSIFYYPSFHYIHNPTQLEKFQKDLDRYLTRKIGFEAVMRIRCTKGDSHCWSYLLDRLRPDNSWLAAAFWYVWSFTAERNSSYLLTWLCRCMTQLPAFCILIFLLLIRLFSKHRFYLCSLSLSRVPSGLSIHTFHGNFFVRSTDLLSLANVNPDSAFAVQMSIDDSLADSSLACFQAALLYTSSKGAQTHSHTLISEFGKHACVRLFSLLCFSSCIKSQSKLKHIIHLSL